MGTDILTGSFPEYITPLGVVVHVAETVPGGLMRLWKSTKEQLAGGVFIAISSIHHLTYDDDYAKSKRCQESLVKSLASTNPNIRVNAIRLGHIVGTKAWPVEDPTRLPEIPLGRFGTVAEVADAVEFMVNSKWMTGTILTLDGGTSAIL
jgi:NAD(P)-dependent dehydrogenase (short-subunit alcohol dehydrogenase family)